MLLQWARENRWYGGPFNTQEP